MDGGIRCRVVNALAGDNRHGCDFAGRRAIFDADHAEPHDRFALRSEYRWCDVRSNPGCVLDHAGAWDSRMPVCAWRGEYLLWNGRVLDCAFVSNSANCDGGKIRRWPSAASIGGATFYLWASWDRIRSRDDSRAGAGAREYDLYFRSGIGSVPGGNRVGCSSFSADAKTRKDDGCGFYFGSTRFGDCGGWRYPCDGHPKFTMSYEMRIG